MLAYESDETTGLSGMSVDLHDASSPLTAFFQPKPGPAHRALDGDGKEILPVGRNCIYIAALRDANALPRMARSAAIPSPPGAPPRGQC